MPFMHQELASGIPQHSGGYKLGYFAPLMHQVKLHFFIGHYIWRTKTSTRNLKCHLFKTTRVMGKIVFQISEQSAGYKLGYFNGELLCSSRLEISRI